MVESVLINDRPDHPVNGRLSAPAGTKIAVLAEDSILLFRDSSRKRIQIGTTYGWFITAYHDDWEDLKGSLVVLEASKRRCPCEGCGATLWEILEEEDGDRRA
jgi:hypothetical protein